MLGSTNNEEFNKIAFLSKSAYYPHQANWLKPENHLQPCINLLVAVRCDDYYEVWSQIMQIRFIFSF